MHCHRIPLRKSFRSNGSIATNVSNVSISVLCSRRRKTGELLQQAGGKDIYGLSLVGMMECKFLKVFAAAQFVIQ